jgi:hypothetical protein
MGKLIDRAFIALLAFGALGHLLGTFTLTDIGSPLFVWSLSGVLAAGMVVAVNVLRHVRGSDPALARIALVGSACWVGIAILFGASIGNILDPRALLHAIAAAGLCYFSFQSSQIV